MFKGPQIFKTGGALGARSANTDNICGLVMGGVVTVGYPTLGTSLKLIQPTDADTLGLNIAYDATNKVQVRYHIDEFFRINPNGTLWIMVIAQGTTMTDMCDNTKNYVRKMVVDSGFSVKNIGVVLNPLLAYSPTLTSGIDGDVLTAIPKAQQLVDGFNALNVFIESIVIEGRQVNGILASIIDLRTKDSENVQVAILQDGDQAALDAQYAKTAAVGTVLGGIGIRRCQEDLGSLQVIDSLDKANPDYPIDSVADGRFQKICISSGAETKTLTPAEIALLKKNGFIFADVYPEYPGVFFSGSPTCTDISSDFAFSTNVRVWCKAARITVQRLTPKVNSTVETEEGTGKLKSTTVTAWELDVNNDRNGVGRMRVEGNCQKSRCFIDPDQDVFGTRTVAVGVAVTPFGYAGEIIGYVGLSR